MSGFAGTVALVERTLIRDGLVDRYRTEHEHVDGLPPGEGAFLPCSFWLANNNYSLLGRRRTLVGRSGERSATFPSLYAARFDLGGATAAAGLANDVGLLSEEYDPVNNVWLLGNFPQAFTHESLINTALHLGGALMPDERCCGNGTGR
jgi:GH15 family glucan-1,4-alpha-glucosidase